MLRERITFWDALVQTTAARRVVSPNAGFCRQAKAVEQCKGSLKSYKGPNNKFDLTYFEWLGLIDQVQKAALVDPSQGQHDKEPLPVPGRDALTT